MTATTRELGQHSTNFLGNIHTWHLAKIPDFNENVCKRKFCLQFSQKRLKNQQFLKGNFRETNFAIFFNFATFSFRENHKVVFVKNIRGT